jgi:ribosomal protein S18
MRIGKILVLLILIAAIANFYGVFDRFSGIETLKDKAKAVAESALPADPIFKTPTTLKDSRGRSLECRILAKHGDTIAVQRNSDQQQFLISSKKLSPGDYQRLAMISDHRTDLIRRLQRDNSSVTANRQARWHGSMDQAVSEARRTGLPIYLLFTGTDW